MNKKLTTLLLAMMLALGSFTGCSSEATEEDVEATADTEEAARISMTLSLWLPTSKNTTEEAIELAEAQINRLTQARFDTAIELKAIPEADYQKTIDGELERIAAALIAEEEEAERKRKELKELKAQGIEVETEPETEEGETEPVEEETIVNELGISVIKYPEVGANQLDIFLVQGYDNYLRYIENEYIQQLDGELSGTSKILKTYIYPTYLSLANVSGTYAIPNNHPVGEYEYLLVNKELVEQYDYNPKDLSTLVKCADFIKDIASQNLEGVTPLLGDVDYKNIVFCGEDPTEFSLISALLSNSSAYNVKALPKSTFTQNAYINTLGMMKELKELGYVGDGKVDEGEKFAVGVVAGDGSVAAQYEDEYYVNIHTKPMMTEEDVYGSMFAVSSYSKSLARSMEIITYLNTNSDIRTILQYGAQGVHWEYDDEDTKETISILSDDYQMDIVNTGNVYMTYPGEGIPMSHWDYAKQQNLDSTSDPFMKFEGFVTDANKAQIEELAALSKQYKDRIDALTYAEWDAEISAIKKELKDNELITSLLDGEENENSIATVYNDWFAENYGG
ncbi:MAG: hypothetical protein J6N32_08365 [Clostridia bacterium]|nr:hypothetical protein [Clostridia bacterium]